MSTIRKQSHKRKSTRSKRCPNGTIKNPKTGRCINKKSSKRKSCPEGKVRNPKTGRCIKEKSPKRKSPKTKKSSKRKSCPEGKVRNPKTGRCIKEKSPKRKSSKQKSPKRKSSKQKSPKRKSPKRKSSKQKSPKRKSPKQKSSKQKSPKQKSPKRKSPKKSPQGSALSDRQIEKIYEKLVLASKRLYDEKELKHFLKQYGKHRSLKDLHHGMILSLVDTSLSIDDRINRIMILFDYINKQDYEMVLRDAFAESLNIYMGQSKRIGNSLHNLIIKNNLQKIFDHNRIKDTLRMNMLKITNDKILNI
jgi:hypothetical protein